MTGASGVVFNTRKIYAAPCASLRAGGRIIDIKQKPVETGQRPEPGATEGGCDPVWGQVQE